MEDYESKLLDLANNIGESFGEYLEQAKGDPEYLAAMYEILSKMLVLVEDELYPDEEN